MKGTATIGELRASIAQTSSQSHVAALQMDGFGLPDEETLALVRDGDMVVAVLSGAMRLLSFIYFFH